MTLHDTIPIVVGVTGHRDIRPEDRDVIYNAVKQELMALQSRCPHSEIVMQNSLADGADQLCAEVARELSVPLIAVLPLDRAEYEKDFSAEALPAFRALCDAAEDCFVAPNTERAPASKDRDFAYRQAGVYVASHAHVLLALWDGAESPASDCGTAAIVHCALNGDYSPEDSIPLGGCCPVLHILSPRTGDDGDAGAVRFLGDRTAFDETLTRTDEFNRLAKIAPASESALLPSDREPDKQLDRIETLYAKADSLSVRFSKQYRRILAALAIISTVITIAFLLYDEAELHGMILVCGGMLLLAWLVQRYGNRFASHRRYLEYRMLAEGLRVQAFLRYAGSGLCASDVLPHSAQTETGWVASALKVLSVGAAPARAHRIRDAWVDGQRRYHERSVRRSKRADKGSERIVRVALWVSILLYLAVLLFELIWGGLLPFSQKIANAEFYRTLSKLLLGSISAATLFISNYYG
ncbi:MAG: hypothetical protein IJ138_04585, partial [Clostridia bacterium]|nr:hypothetical protein [Clostridia bacterium]